MYATSGPIQTQSYTNLTPDRTMGPVEIEVNKAQEYMERLHHALSSLDERLQLVFQPAPKDSVGGSSPKVVASCELHERLQKCTDSIDSAITRINSMAARVQL